MTKLVDLLTAFTATGSDESLRVNAFSYTWALFDCLVKKVGIELSLGYLALAGDIMLDYMAASLVISIILDLVLFVLHLLR